MARHPNCSAADRLVADRDGLAGVAVEALNRLLEAVLLGLDEGDVTLAAMPVLAGLVVVAPIAGLGGAGLVADDRRTDEGTGDAEQGSGDGRLAAVLLDRLDLKTAIGSRGVGDERTADHGDGQGGGNGLGEALGHDAHPLAGRRSVRR